MTRAVLLLCLAVCALGWSHLPGVGAVPVITGLSGCPFFDPANNLNGNCTAGSLLTITGSGFSPSIASTFVLTVYTAFVPAVVISTSTTEVVFELPKPIKGSAGRSDARYYVLVEADCELSSVSVWQMLWYAADQPPTNHSNAAFFPSPKITSLTGCDSNGTSTANCTDGATVVIHGSGFGCSNAIVFFANTRGFYAGNVKAVGQNALSAVLPPNPQGDDRLYAMSVFSHGFWSNQFQGFSYGWPLPPLPIGTITSLRGADIAREGELLPSQ